MLPVERVIGESGLTVAPGRARVEIRLPWYRSLPLSTVSIAGLEVDGQPVALDEVQFDLGSRALPVTQLEELTDEFWYVLDSAYLSFPAEVAQGSTHEVGVTVSVFPPYIPGMQRTNRQVKQLQAGAMQ